MNRSPASGLEALAQLGPIVDAHHHFWDLERNSYPWLQDAVTTTHFGDYAAIRRTYLPSDLRKNAAPITLLASVHVEAHWRGGREPEGETAWLDNLMSQTGLPTAIVGHVDLLGNHVEESLDAHLRSRRFRGVRMLTRRTGPPSGAGLMRDATFRTGLKSLATRGLSFDLQATGDTMVAATELAADMPDLAIALTHAGLPLDRSKDGVGLWREGIVMLSKQPNVTAKLSGLPMTDWSWTLDSLRPFVEHLLHCFGSQRVMFGSNFPVDGLFSSYGDLVASYAAIVRDFSTRAVSDVFRDTAIRFYRLSPDQA